MRRPCEAEFPSDFYLDVLHNSISGWDGASKFKEALDLLAGRSAGCRVTSDLRLLDV